MYVGSGIETLLLILKITARHAGFVWLLCRASQISFSTFFGYSTVLSYAATAAAATALRRVHQLCNLAVDVGRGTPKRRGTPEGHAFA